MRWRRGATALAVAALALSAVVVPARGQVVAEDPVPEPTPTTVTETTVTETTVPEPTTVTETTVTPTETPPETTVLPPAVAEPTDPDTTVPEPDVGGHATTTTAAEMTDVTTTVEPPTPEPADAPTARFAPFSAAGALTGLTLTITDLPFAVSPTTLAFDTYVVGSTATETVTLVNDTGRLVVFEAGGFNGVAVIGVTGCPVLDPNLAPDEYVLEADQTCDLSVTVDTSSVGPVTGQLVVSDTNIFRAATTTVTAEVVPPDAPANDDWVNAQDLSTLAIPPFVGVPGQFPGTQQPRDTLEVDGSTEFATYESGEYFSRPGGSVWFRYTSPPGGFAGRLGYRATPGFFVDVTTDNTSATDSQRAQGNTWPPSSIRHVRMEPGHTVWFRVFNEFADPGRFTLELFQAPDEQDSIVEAYPSGEFALTTDFNLFGDGDTHHLTSDFPGGTPNGWSTLRFAVPGSLSVTYRSATARTVGPFEGNEGSERPLGLRIHRSPQPEQISDPLVLGAPIAVGVGGVSDTPVPLLSGPRWETTATVQVTPGRYYWTYEEDPLGPTFFLTDVRFRAAGDVEPPTASITTPPDGARYAVGSVPSSVASSCTDDQGSTSSFVTVDGIETTSLATTLGDHTVSLECTDSAGNTVAVTSTYTVFLSDVTPPAITITGVTGAAVITTASPTLTITSNEPLFGAICTLETPVPGGGSSANDVGCLADGLSSDILTLRDLPDGRVTFTVSAVDEAGNRRTVSVTFFVSEPPVVTITNPADGTELLPTEVPASVQYTCTDNSGVVLPDVEVQVVLAGGPAVLIGPPPSTVGSHTIRVLCFDEENTEGVGEATYTVISDGSGPCVFVDTPSVDFGDIPVGQTSSDRAVVVRSCSTSPITLAASVSNATTVGSAQTWLASTSTVPADNEFVWSVTPTGGTSPVPVGPISPATIGPVLAPGASRTDTHRLRLGPTGPGLGSRFSSTITYTAVVSP